MIPDFFERYDHLLIPEPNSGCLLWLGSLTTGGYGNLTFEGESYYAHRCALECELGRPLLSAHALHRCDLPCCCEPEHLFEGTHADNMHDMFRKGRRRRYTGLLGEDHHQARLTAAQVREIRASDLAGVDIATQYRIGTSQVSRIKNWRSWAHVN